MRRQSGCEGERGMDKESHLVGTLTLEHDLNNVLSIARVCLCPSRKREALRRRSWWIVRRRKELDVVHHVEFLRRSEGEGG